MRQVELIQKNLVDTYRVYLKNQRIKFDFESFEYQLQLSFTKIIISYKVYNAKRIVFCEGFGIVKNIFFNYLPIK